MAPLPHGLLASLGVQIKVQKFDIGPPRVEQRFAAPVQSLDVVQYLPMPMALPMSPGWPQCASSASFFPMPASVIEVSAAAGASLEVGASLPGTLVSEPPPLSATVESWEEESAGLPESIVGRIVEEDELQAPRASNENTEKDKTFMCP